MNMTHPEHRSDAGLATALRISVSRLARRLRVERTVPGLTEPDLSETQLAALAALERHGAMTPGELADHEKVQPPSMTRVISVLVEAQLVRREPHASDRRQVMLTVTDAGRELVNRARRRRQPDPGPVALLVSAGRRRSGRCPPGTTGCSPPGRSSPTPAHGCSGWPRTGWSCSSPTAAEPRSASPSACSSCPSCCSASGAA